MGAVSCLEARDARATRYYHVNSVNAAIEAMAKNQNRVMLVMATGTAKTYTAFQIIGRLWKTSRKKRILFLADRNVLIDQTMVNASRPLWLNKNRGVHGTEVTASASQDKAVPYGVLIFQSAPHMEYYTDGIQHTAEC